MIEPTALLAWARADISPPYTAFGVFGGHDTKTTAPSGTESICHAISTVMWLERREVGGLCSRNELDTWDLGR